MTPLTFRLRHDPKFFVDVSALTPDRLQGQSAGNIVRLPLYLGRERIAVGDLFDVQGDDATELVFSGDLARIDRIGAGMRQGTILVEGSCGSYLGLGMKSGEIEVRGNAELYAGSGMTGGKLIIHGNAGDFLGGALAGERRGMAGGTVIVKGNAGDRAGDMMRRGMLLIEGSAGSYCASRMLAGTVGVLGNVADHPCYGMKRGTMILPRGLTEYPATFGDCGVHDLGFLTLLRRAWQSLPSRFASLEWRSNRVRRWMGDLANRGRGEVLVFY